MQDIEKKYKEYFNAVYKYLLSLTHDKYIAQDIVQETFCKAVKYIDSYNGNCKMSVWLCQIAKNLWYDKCKKDKKVVNLPEEELINIVSMESVEENIIDKNEKLDLYKRLQKIDEKSREVIYLRIYGELTFKEIGDILGKTENWAKIVFYRAKKKLKKVGDENEKQI